MRFKKWSCMYFKASQKCHFIPNWKIWKNHNKFWLHLINYHTKKNLVKIGARLLSLISNQRFKKSLTLLLGTLESQKIFFVYNCYKKECFPCNAYLCQISRKKLLLVNAPLCLLGACYIGKSRSIFEGWFTPFQLEYFDNFCTFGILVYGLVNKISFLEQSGLFHFWRLLLPNW